MAWDWFPVASTAAVGIAAIVGSTWTAAWGKRQDRALAAERHEHERLTAHENWIRERRNDAYIGLLDLAEETGLYVQRVHPMWSSGGPDPELPDHEAQRLVRARVMAYGSSTVKDRMGEWHALVQRVIFAASAVSDNVDGARSQLHDLRETERAARQALGEQVSIELQSPPRPSSEPPPRQIEP